MKNMMHVILLLQQDAMSFLMEPGSRKQLSVHGTAELLTENLFLRRYRPDDAVPLYERLGTDPEMYRYSGWNPYATPEMAEETVRRFIESYADDHSYSWVMEFDGIVAGTIGAYDYERGQIEVGLSVVRRWQGRGFATEALQGAIIPVLNDEILAEYEEVLSRPKFRFQKKTIEIFLNELKKRAVYSDCGLLDDVIPDPKDVVFYAVLMEKRKDSEAYLVTGNIKHFPVRTYIVTPREMLDIIEEGK